MNELPIFCVPIRKGDGPLIKMDSGVVSSSAWMVRALPTYDGLLSSDTGKLTDILDLTRLTLPSREMLAFLLLMPLGVLASEMLRQFAGIRTYGIFTQPLLALAVTQFDWFTALIVLALVTIIGVAIRSVIPGLNLQRTSRLAIVFTLVAMSMSLLVSGISYFDPAVDSTVALLPLVILTMLIDRIYTVYDERGAQSAIVRLFWAVIAATVSIYIMLQAHWGTFLVTYPEVHAATLAAIILIGLYRGSKLSDTSALRWLREPTRKVRDRKTDMGQPEKSGETMVVERQDPH
ncbi:MAG: 7TM domain-containing protein [Gammaproteobacteria bacterium]